MVTRGSLHGPDDAPSTGERFVPVLQAGRGEAGRGEAGKVVIEQILSGESDGATTYEPMTYTQTQDEWVVVLTGGATLDVDGETCVLGPGDWVMLPAGVPHTVVHTDAATTWLAVHIHP